MNGHGLQGIPPRKQQGSETVEFAISSTLLFIILFGIIEFSVALYDKAILTNASREGARTGILYRYDASYERNFANVLVEDDLIEQVIRDYAEQYLISLGGSAEMDIDIQRTDSNGNLLFDAGDELVVDINYPYQFLLLPGFIGTLGDLIDIQAVSSMRAE